MKTNKLVEKYNSVSEELSIYSSLLDNSINLNQDEYFEALTTYYYLVGQLELLTELITDRAHTMSYSVDYDYLTNEETGVEYSVIKSVDWEDK